MGVDRRHLDPILNGEREYPFLSRFLFTLTPHPEMSVDGVLAMEDLKLLIASVRADNPKNNDKRKSVHAENINDANLTQSFVSLTNCADSLKGDRSTIRGYLNETSRGLYRGQ